MNMHSLIDLVRQLRDGSLGSRELVTDTLQRIDAQAGLNAFVSVDAERALAEAERADNRPATDRGPLHGVPIALKDIFCRQNSRTTAGSRMLEHWVAPYDATVVERLEAAGAVLVGKTNMDEFAMGSSGENSFFGATRNPWHQNHVPGGSSSGSAAAVAAGTVPAAIGTDTGGSIRQPAAFCGLTGLKPTYGRVSRWGMIAFASSLDQAGPMAWNAEDAALLMHVMAGFDERDSTSLDVPGEDYSATLNTPVKGLRLGIPAAFLGDAVDPEIRAALEAACNEYRALGVELVEIDLPHALEGVAAYYVIAPAEASANLARFDGVRYGYRCEAPQSLEDLYLRSRGEGFGAEVKRRILTGTYALSIGYYDAYYRRAQRIRRLIRDDFLTAFESVDAILTPTTPSVAFRLGEKVADPVTMYQQDLFTIPANLAGIPALSMPAGFSEGLPIGVQLMGPHFSEARLLQLAHAFQQVSNHHLQQPEGGAGA